MSERAVSEHLINMHIFKSQKVTFLYELLLAVSAISTIIIVLSSIHL